MSSKAIAPIVLLAMMVVLVPTASASITGTLDIEGAGVIVSAGAIDWLPSSGAGTISTTSISDLTYDSGTALGVTTGKIVDLIDSPATYPVTDFLTFASAPGLSFTLAGIGPSGTTNYNCLALTSGNACAISPTSPFLLTRIGNQTAVILSAFGWVTDSLGEKSTWSGLFTAQLPNLTPGQIQANFAANPDYFIQSSYSGTFLVTPESTVPESSTSTMALAGLGLLLLARIPFRRRRA